jgi:hypothetical protein
MSWMLAIRPNQRPQSGEQLRAVLDGHAEIPTRGRPGITVPGLLDAAAAPQVEQVVDATQIKTAYLPTYLPTARVAPPSDSPATTFSPTAPMPTARPAPIETPPPRQPEQRAPATPQPAQTAPQRPAPQRTAPPPVTAAVPPTPPRVAPPAATSPAPLSAAKSGPPSVAAPLTPPPSAAASRRREGPPSQPASWAASRPATLPPGASGLHSRPAVTVPPMSRPAPLAAAQAAPGVKPRRGGSTPWLVLAGGGLFVAVAAIAAWQFSGRRDAAVVEQASAASAAASSLAVTAPTPAAVRAPVPAAPMIVEAADPAATTMAKDAKAPMTAPPITATGDTSARASIADRAPVADGGAASAARVRPPGKPVPRVGEDPALATTTGANPARPVEYPNTGAPPTNTERPRPQAATPREYAGTQRQIPSIAEAAPESVREACGKRGFIALAVCLDEKCEEPRFRSTPECIGILARKTSRQNQ